MDFESLFSVLSALSQAESARRRLAERIEVHELSIAASIVEAVAESASAYHTAHRGGPAARRRVCPRVIEDSLQFC